MPLRIFYLLTLLFPFRSSLPFPSNKKKTKLGEHPAAMQRGCANNNINLSILLYILSLSLLIQYLNRVLSTFMVIHVISPPRNRRGHEQLLANTERTLDLKWVRSQTPVIAGSEQTVRLS